jgi:hypothetical protein
VPQFVLTREPATWPAAARLCAAAPAAGQASCYRGIGNSGAGILAATPRAVGALCAAAGAAGRRACIAGAAEETVDLDWSGGWRADCVP